MFFSAVSKTQLSLFNLGGSIKRCISSLRLSVCLFRAHDYSKSESRRNFKFTEWMHIINNLPSFREFLQFLKRKTGTRIGKYGW